MKRQSATDIETVRRDIEERGAKIVYDTMLEICQDKTVPAQARVAAAGNVLRAGGLYEVRKRPSDEDPSEMTAAELRQALPVLEAELARIEARKGKSIEEEDEDLFD